MNFSSFVHQKCENKLKWIRMAVLLLYSERFDEGIVINFITLDFIIAIIIHFGSCANMCVCVVFIVIISLFVFVVGGIFRFKKSAKTFACVEYPVQIPRPRFACNVRCK